MPFFWLTLLRSSDSPCNHEEMFICPRTERDKLMMLPVQTLPPLRLGHADLRHSHCGLPCPSELWARACWSWPLSCAGGHTTPHLAIKAETLKHLPEFLGAQCHHPQVNVMIQMRKIPPQHAYLLPLSIKAV